MYITEILDDLVRQLIYFHSFWSHNKNNYCIAIVTDHLVNNNLLIIILIWPSRQLIENSNIAWK